MVSRDTEHLDYCGVRSLCGREVADEMFGRVIPRGLDMDFPADEDAVANIVSERERARIAQAFCHDLGD